jgi:hypothetical protein
MCDFVGRHAGISQRSLKLVVISALAVIALVAAALVYLIVQRSKDAALPPSVGVYPVGRITTA